MPLYHTNLPCIGQGLNSLSSFEDGKNTTQEQESSELFESGCKIKGSYALCRVATFKGTLRAQVLFHP